MVIAGPVFPEWYWGPIFFLVLYSPFLAGGTTAIYLSTRRAAKRRGWHRRIWAAPLHVALSFALALVLALAGASVYGLVQGDTR